MTLPDPQSNEPLTLEQITSLRERIANRQATINIMNDSIIEQKDVFSISTAAIAHLEPALLRAKHALTTQKKLLNTLLKMKLDFDIANRVPGPNWAEESKAKDMCMTMTSSVADRIDQAKDSLSYPIERLDKNISDLHCFIQEMEMAVYTERLMLAECKEHLSGLMVLRNSTKSRITLLRSRLNHVKRTPAEIWSRIFMFRVHAAMQKYFQDPGSEVMPLVARDLSHVCRFWRSIASSQRALWQFVPTPASNLWSIASIEQFQNIVSSRNNSPTLVCSLFVRQHYYFAERKKPSIVGVYNLHIIARGNSGKNQPCSIPFRQPESLKLQFLSPPDLEVLSALLRPFSKLKTLEIIATGDHPSLALSLSTTQPHLTILKLDLMTFQPFDVAEYLSPKLQELHIMHNGASSIPSLTTVVRLPKLRVLGVTVLDTDFIHTLEITALMKLILYGPKMPSIPIPSLTQFANTLTFGGVEALELRNWPSFNTIDPKGNIGNIMEAIIPIVESLRSIQSLGCLDSAIDGSRLLEICTYLKEGTSSTGCKLEHVTIDCCSGITRDDCEAIGQLVEKIEIYV